MRDDRTAREQRDNSGPSTNDDEVPDGLEGSIMNDDQGPDSDGHGTRSKARGDREEGSDRTVHDL